MNETLPVRSHLAALFEEQRRAFDREPFPSHETRLSILKVLDELIAKNSTCLAAAINQDFGNRPAQETELAEIHLVRSEIAHLKRNLRRWMARRRVSTSLEWLPGKSYLFPQPLGVVGIISPWNYPVQLALAPMAAALAAGNRVMLKVSEHTPRTSRLLSEIIANTFDDDLVAVVEGEAEIAQAFAELPFDHLFFTGSTAVGRIVAAAAAPNLTPVTLELGGKSPAVVDKSADIRTTANRIVHGKLLNAGQTCVAPDYVLVEEPRVEEFVSAITKAAQTLYPAATANRDYTAILGGERKTRLETMLREAQEAGARIIPLLAPETNLDSGQMAPVLVIDPSPEIRLMKEEIFGPILPVLTFQRVEDALLHIRNNARPLALYWFGKPDGREKQVLAQTHAGGVTINGTLFHMAQANLPFGGIGASGSGAYHGEAGFRLFSHDKPVFVESRFSGAALLRPPFGAMFDRVMSLLGLIR